MTETSLGVGEELQRAREARGLTLSEVAQQLKFAPRQIESLEQERFERLPGATIARGMLRSYAKLLKIDPEPLVQRVSDRFGTPDASHLAARYSQPVPFSDNGRRSTLVYLGLSLGVLAVGGGVAYEWHHERSAPAAIAKAAAPASSATVPPAPAIEQEAPVRRTVVEQPALAVADAVQKKAEPVAVAKSEPVKAELTAPAVAKSAPKVVPAGVHRLVIRCEEEAWIEVKDAKDRMLVSSLNPKGAERVVQSRGPLLLVIGNAEHVRVTHNDRPIDLQPHTKAAIARFSLP